VGWVVVEGVAGGGDEVGAGVEVGGGVAIGFEEALFLAGGGLDF
jgi:hypothetical protein